MENNQSEYFFIPSTITRLKQSIILVISQVSKAFYSQLDNDQAD